MEKVIEHLEQERSVLIKDVESMNNEIDRLREEAKRLQKKRDGIIESLVQIEKAIAKLHKEVIKD